VELRKRIPIAAGLMSWYVSGPGTGWTRRSVTIS
jgi:hypothetical protein